MKKHQMELVKTKRKFVPWKMDVKKLQTAAQRGKCMDSTNEKMRDIQARLEV